MASGDNQTLSGFEASFFGEVVTVGPTAAEYLPLKWVEKSTWTEQELIDLFTRVLESKKKVPVKRKPKQPGDVRTPKKVKNAAQVPIV